MAWEEFPHSLTRQRTWCALRRLWNGDVCFAPQSEHQTMWRRCLLKCQQQNSTAGIEATASKYERNRTRNQIVQCGQQSVAEFGKPCCAATLYPHMNRAASISLGLTWQSFATCQITCDADRTIKA
jgi:hypothetical protein